MYHQPLRTLCTSYNITVSLNSYDLCISYAELQDSHTVEFAMSHPKEYEIYYIMDGTLEVLVNDEYHCLEKGDFLLLDKGVKHDPLYKPNQPKSYLTVIFSIQKRATALYNSSTLEFEERHIEMFFKLLEEKPYYIGSDAYFCCKYVDRISNELTMKEWGWFYRLQFLYAGFILGIIQNIIPPLKVSEKCHEENLPIAFTKYLHANYQNPELSLQSVANHFYMSTRHVNRLFKEFFGSSLSKTLTQYRIQYAKNYLIDTEYSVEEIAEQVGFSSASTLSRLFKETKGITISEYRYQCKRQLHRADSFSHNDAAAKKTSDFN